MLTIILIISHKNITKPFKNFKTYKLAQFSLVCSVLKFAHKNTTPTAHSPSGTGALGRCLSCPSRVNPLLGGNSKTDPSTLKDATNLDLHC